MARFGIRTRRGGAPSVGGIAPLRLRALNEGARAKETLRPGRRSSPAGGHEPINALFANSVNSPSVSMVNFSCCVGQAPDRSKRHGTPRVITEPHEKLGRIKL